MLIYKELTTEFLSKLEQPKDSRYACRLVETKILDLKDKAVMSSDKIEDIIDRYNGEIWKIFNVCFLDYENEATNTQLIFVNDVFLSKGKYSIILQIYVAPCVELRTLYDRHAIGVIYHGQ